jgi:hypothetical protein
MTYGDPAWRGWKWVRNDEESRPFIEADRAWLEEPYRPRAVQGHD